MKRNSRLRRRARELTEALLAAAALVAALPVLAVAAACLAIESGFPVLFRQVRLGRGGKPFTLLKLRSMRAGAKGPDITAGEDPRITRVGAFLRKYKIDELPQLWNVLKGDMQLIGARPEVPSMVDHGDPLWQAVLSEKPGLSDVATLVYRSEQELLAQFTDPDRAYREEILPQKLRLSAAYMSRRSLAADCRLLMLTVRYSLLPSNFDQARILKLLAGAQD